MRMEAIGPRHIQQAVNRLAETLKPATVRSYYGVLAHLFSDAVDLELIGRSPCRAIRLHKVAHEVKRVVGPDDLHRLADEVGPDWRLLIYLGGVMGLRIGEALGLRWTDVDLTARTVTISRRTMDPQASHLKLSPLPAPFTVPVTRCLGNDRLAAGTGMLDDVE